MNGDSVTISDKGNTEVVPIQSTSLNQTENPFAKLSNEVEELRQELHDTEIHVNQQSGAKNYAKTYANKVVDYQKIKDLPLSKGVQGTAPNRVQTIEIDFRTERRHVYRVINDNATDKDKPFKLTVKENCSENLTPETIHEFYILFDTVVPTAVTSVELFDENGTFQGNMNVQMSNPETFNYNSGDGHTRILQKIRIIRSAGVLISCSCVGSLENINMNFSLVA